MSQHARSRPADATVGTVAKGQDGEQWVVCELEAGSVQSHKWIRVVSDSTAEGGASDSDSGSRPSSPPCSPFQPTGSSTWHAGGKECEAAAIGLANRLLQSRAGSTGLKDDNDGNSASNDSLGSHQSGGSTVYSSAEDVGGGGGGRSSERRRGSGGVGGTGRRPHRLLDNSRHIYGYAVV